MNKIRNIFAWYNRTDRDGLSAAILAGAMLAALVMIGA